MANDFSDVIVLTITSCACLYVVCYISKKAARIDWIKTVLSAVGRNSLYIMGLHFIGFKIATIIINLRGFNKKLAILVPEAGSDLLLFIIYILFGVGIPLMIVFWIRVIKRFVFSLKIR